jgi:hypothetical protein
MRPKTRQQHRNHDISGNAWWQRPCKLLVYFDTAMLVGFLAGARGESG